MFVAGGLMWANVYGRCVEQWNECCQFEHGWPFDGAFHTVEIIKGGETYPPEFRTLPLIFNALIALSILFAVWFLCEWLIRRRDARKGR